MKDLDKLGIDIETSLAVIALASPPVDSVVTVTGAHSGQMKLLLLYIQVTYVYIYIFMHVGMLYMHT